MVYKSAKIQSIFNITFFKTVNFNILNKKLIFQISKKRKLYTNQRKPYSHKQLTNLKFEIKVK